MTMQETDPSVLILASTGSDAALVDSILTEAQIPAEVCGHADAFIAALDTAGCAVVTTESLSALVGPALTHWIGSQPPWSDFPFILLTARGTPPDAPLADGLGNVSLVERPFHPATLVTAVRFAARARRRQRDAEAHQAERQQTAERQSLLIRELHHRVKNTLATVQALLGASARTAGSVEEFYNGFSARVVSLAKTHNLLTEDYWQTASLRDILRNELGPYDSDAGDRIHLEGPVVELSADLAVPTGMAIHELTTNAAKHGSLSVPQGLVDIRWDVTRLEGSRRLHLEWVERGGPPIPDTRRRGFGSTLLQRVLTVQCGAEIQFEFPPSGLRFSMDAPIVEHRTVPHY